MHNSRKPALQKTEARQPSASSSSSPATSARPQYDQARPTTLPTSPIRSRSGWSSSSRGQSTSSSGGARLPTIGKGDISSRASAGPERPSEPKHSHGQARAPSSRWEREALRSSPRIPREDSLLEASRGFVRPTTHDGTRRPSLSVGRDDTLSRGLGKMLSKSGSLVGPARDLERRDSTGSLGDKQDYDHLLAHILIRKVDEDSGRLSRSNSSSSEREALERRHSIGDIRPREPPSHSQPHGRSGLAAEHSLPPTDNRRRGSDTRSHHAATGHHTHSTESNHGHYQSTLHGLSPLHGGSQRHPQTLPNVAGAHGLRGSSSHRDSQVRPAEEHHRWPSAAALAHHGRDKSQERDGEQRISAAHVNASAASRPEFSPASDPFRVLRVGSVESGRPGSTGRKSGNCVTEQQRRNSGEDRRGKTFKTQLVELVRPLLDPSYSAGTLTREQYKAVLKEVGGVFISYAARMWCLSVVVCFNGPF